MCCWTREHPSHLFAPFYAGDYDLGNPILLFVLRWGYSVITSGPFSTGFNVMMVGGDGEGLAEEQRVNSFVGYHGFLLGTDMV